MKPHWLTGPSNLVNWKQLETLLNLRPYMSINRFIPATGEYKWDNHTWATGNCWPVSSIRNCLKETPAYITDTSHLNKEINNYCLSLEKQYKAPVDCHIYFSITKKNLGFGFHKDQSHNVIIVQEGKVKMTVRDLGEKELSAGEGVFIPSNIYHCVEPISDKRISCSFPIYNEYEKHYYEDREWFSFD